jgi:hypothetical protein
LAEFTLEARDLALPKELFERKKGTTAFLTPSEAELVVRRATPAVSLTSALVKVSLPVPHQRSSAAWELPRSAPENARAVRRKCIMRTHTLV